MNTFAAATSFPIAHLEFAASWAAIAPGGWNIAVDLDDDGGEVVSVFPPGADLAAFVIGIEEGVVETAWHHHAELGGGIEARGSHATLPRAVLALCPLTWRQLRKVLKATREATTEAW